MRSSACQFLLPEHRLNQLALSLHPYYFPPSDIPQVRLWRILLVHDPHQAIPLH